MEVATEHVHILLGFPPKYSISIVVEIIKAVSAREIRKEYSEVEKALWRGEFREDGDFLRTIGDRVAEEIVKKYLSCHEEISAKPEQLQLF